MSAENWPSSLRIDPDSYDEGPFHEVTVQQARDLSELRIHHGEGWGATFTVKTVGATERSTLIQFFGARKGTWDTFFFTSPEDSVTRLVRFAVARLVGRKLGPTVREYRIELVTPGG